MTVLSSRDRTERVAGALRTRRARIVAVLAAGALVLTGCAAGQRAATSEAIPVVDGVTADLGPIALRNLTIATPPKNFYDKGADAALQVYIVNNGPVDQLVSISSSAAASVVISSTGASSSESAGASESASPSASPTDSAGTANTPVDLASGELTRIGVDKATSSIMIKGLNAQLYPAMSIPITFTFAKAGTVTVQVSVHLSEGEVTAPTLPITHDETADTG